ncbi:MAG: hypothetical protein QM733_21635 [Ilumatobacteraceae bacterium]
MGEQIERVARRQHLAEGQPPALRLMEQVIARTPLRCLLDRLAHLGGQRGAAHRVGQPLVVEEVEALDEDAHLLPLRVGERVEPDVAVGAAHVERGAGVVGVAPGEQLAAPVEDQRAERAGDRTLQRGDVDQLAAATTRSPDDRAKGRHGGVGAGDGGDEIPADLERLAPGIAARVRPRGRRTQRQMVGAMVGGRTGRAERGDHADDDVRVDPAKLLLVEAAPGEHRRRTVGNDHVAAGGELPDHLAAGGVVEIGADAALAGVEVEVRRSGAVGARWIDADDVGAEVTEQLGAEHPGGRGAQVEDAFRPQRPAVALLGCLWHRSPLVGRCAATAT